MNLVNHSIGVRNFKYTLFVTFLLGMLTAFGPFVTDMYLSALPAMMESFDTSASMVQLSLTCCMVGLGLGQLAFGPLSDRYGRKPLLVGTILFYILSTLFCLYSDTICLFVLFRLFQGMAASGSIVIARSIATDLYDGHQLAKMLAVVGSINGFAPVLAPVIGGMMVKTTGWEGIFAVLLGIGVVLLIAVCFFRESLPVERRLQSTFLHTISDYKPLLKNRSYMGYMLQLGFAQAAIFTNIASAPFIMQQYFGFTPEQFSLCFGMNAVAIVVSASVGAKFKQIEKGTMCGCYGLLLFAVSEAIALIYGCNFWVYELLLIGILLSLGLCFTCSTALSMEFGRQHSGSASALLGAVSFALGGLVSPLTGIGNTCYATGILFVICAVGSLLSRKYAIKRNSIRC